METFAVDKSFYDIGASDLKELWDSDLDPAITEVFRGDPDIQEWSAFLDVKPQIILHDRLMTDAALGTMLPIKTEHSYSMTSDNESIPPDSPISLEIKVDDMEDECYPCIPLNSATGQTRLGAESPEIYIKDEPMSDDSDDSDCSMSPDSPPPLIHTNMQQSLLKQPTVLLSSSSRSQMYTAQQRLVMPKLNIKLEGSTGSGFSLPPTPPSSSSSDSEGNVSPDHNPSSPERLRQSSGGGRVVFSSSSAGVTNRQPIQTSLISNQPKGSTGMLVLTEEEKRTLLAEGYPIPTRLPLTKSEEKSLKKIRRKIKNKISAQESRRKKKEYMDALERKVEILTSENNEYKTKIDILEDNNTSLLSQLQKLQSMVARSNSVARSNTNLSQTANQHLTRSSLK